MDRGKLLFDDEKQVCESEHRDGSDRVVPACAGVKREPFKKT
jgi:hypothetical protein